MPLGTIFHIEFGHPPSTPYKCNSRYVDQLGMVVEYDTKAYCRQTLVGGNYGLLDTTSFIPNPDYYRLAFQWSSSTSTRQPNSVSTVNELNIAQPKKGDVNMDRGRFRGSGAETLI